ncbi:MAG: thioredoxin [Elusimicrobiota bacterium]
MKVELNQNNFKKKVLKSKKPVLVDFWAEWCMPCKIIEPAIEVIADEYKGKLKVCSLNIDKARQIAIDYGIMSIPFLGIFKNGELVDNIVGAVSKDVIEEKIKDYL